MGFLSKFKKDKEGAKADAKTEGKAVKEDPKGTAKQAEQAIKNKGEAHETQAQAESKGSAAGGAAAGGATGAAAGTAAGDKNAKSTSTSTGTSTSSKQFVKDIQARRTVYTLNKELPISKKEIESLVQAVIDGTPSSFNSQPVRALILFDAKHDQLWDGIAVDALKKVVREENWEATGNKLKGFAAAAGTVLFFEDSDSITKMQEQFPSYAANFPIWAGHSSGATQIHLWEALALENVGANLQHYSPLIDEGVNETFSVPKNWVLTAQLVFGGLASPAPSAPEKQKDTVRVA